MRTNAKSAVSAAFRFLLSPPARARLLLACAAWPLFAAWCGTIYYLSSIPAGDVNIPLFGIPNGDKIAHVLAFAAGSMILACAIHYSTRWPASRKAAATVIAIALFGASDEWHQLSTPNRSGADIGDWIADIIGATAAAGVFLYGIKRSGKTAGR